MRPPATIRFLTLPLFLLLVFFATPAAAIMPIEGTWRLDERASKNVPDSVKGVELKITLKGNVLSTTRLLDGKPLSDPLVITLDGVPADREISPGQRGTIEGRWQAQGKLLEQIVRLKAGNFLPTTQTTHVTVSEDGQIMTRVQTQIQGGDKTERVMVYRKKS